MDLTKQHKLMLLFLSPQNPLLRRIRVVETGRKCKKIDKADIEEITSVCHQTPENWKQGLQIRESTPAKAFEHTLQFLDTAADRMRKLNRLDVEEYEDVRRSIERFAAAYENEDLNVYDAARTLGMSAVEFQQELDSLIYKRWPLLPAVYYPQAPKNARADDPYQKEADRYEGVYLVWVRRDKLWLQCPLRVRYLQPLGAGRFIRCKMNFPIIDRLTAQPEPGDKRRKSMYWEYDGFLVVREKKLYWTFEKRQRERNDYFHFITHAESKATVNSVTLSGRYLTTGQDDDQSIVTGALLMHRLFSDGTQGAHGSYQDIMWTHAKVLTATEEIAEAERRWQKYCARPEDDRESS